VDVGVCKPGINPAAVQIDAFACNHIPTGEELGNLAITAKDGVNVRPAIHMAIGIKNCA
jgi:hypothetical protein